MAQLNIMTKHNKMVVILMSSLCVICTACGFRPLYNQTGAANSQALSSVVILKIKDRSGQKLRNFLLERFFSNQRSGITTHTLKVVINEEINELNIRKDGSATRAKLKITANFYLTHTASGKQFKGKVSSTSSYNMLGSDFATLGAESDARNRALRSIAEDLRLRVAGALTNVPRTIEKIIYPKKDIR